MDFEILRVLYMALVNLWPIFAFNNLCAWITYKLTKKIVIIDCFWGINHLVAGIVYWKHFGYQTDIMTILQLVVLAVWSIRLSGYLFIQRVYKPYVEDRYDYLALELRKIKPQNKDKYFLLSFQIQALLLCFTSTTLYYVFSNSKKHFPFLNVIGVLFAGISIIGEHISDRQLTRFKEIKGKTKTLCKIGFWKKSRHPNLFFEFCVWFGFGISGLKQIPSDIFAFFGPWLVYQIVTKITGKIQESLMKRKYGKDYEEYLQQTNSYYPF